MNDGLRPPDRDAIRQALANCPKIRRAVLFGSRAMGTNSPTSDVDLAVSGDDVTLRDIARIADAIDERCLPVDVDLLRLESITSQSLRDHIASHGQVFWDRGDSLERDAEPANLSSSG